jgi:DNA polymerase I-like protein with 3'-5' exonuclease and polymerase domains
MNFLTIDFETYYDKDFSLSKMTTEEYIRDDRFEAIGVSVKVGDEPAQWFSGTKNETKDWLDQFEMEKYFVVAHNMMFDGAILAWYFGIHPFALMDTLAMLRAVDGTEVGNSLAKAAERYGVGKKGTEVVAAMGKRRRDFSPADLQQYGEYCKNDVEITYKLFEILRYSFKNKELRLIDLTLRMFTKPVLQLSLPLLEQHLIDVVDKKEALIAATKADKDTLMSNPKFAQMLISLKDDDGKQVVEPPTKISPTTGKVTFAFSKTDDGLKELAEHPDLRVQALVAARLGNKSTLEETRTQRFIDIAKRGSLPVPLRYYAAHTGRWGGDDKLNLQNLPRGKKGEPPPKLKCAIMPPEGYVLIDSDSSQIEARVLAWLAGQNDLVDAFESGEDVYRIMAAKIYRRQKLENVTDDERFVGKTTILGCISGGTLVLSDSGWKPIEQVTLEDKLWDGEEWVCHQGLQNSGIKETLNLCGMWLTPDHRVWSGTQWLEAQSLVQDASTLSQALDTAAENLPLQATFADKGEALLRLSSNVTADLTSTAWTTITLNISKARAVRFVPKLLQTSNGIGCIRTQWLTMDTEPDFSIDWLLPSQGVTPQPTKHTLTMEGVAYQCTSNGGRSEPRFFTIYKRLKAGMYRALKWTGLMSTGITNPTTFALYPEVTTLETNEKSQTSNQKLQTYDLAYAGPRNRYMVLTAQGPMVVHNCGYGMGHVKFRAQLRAFNVDLSEEWCKKVLRTYRDEYSHIPALWEEAHVCLDALSDEKLKTCIFGKQPQAVNVLPGIGFDMPSGLPLKYMDLRPHEIDERGRKQYIYSTRRGIVRIYGGKVVENICQALARCVIGEQMLKVAERYQVVLTVHDAVACIVREEEKEEAARYVQECMRWRPKWAQTLPLNCEVKYGDSYGTTTKFKG